MDYLAIPFDVGTGDTYKIGEGALMNSGIFLLYISSKLAEIPKKMCYGCKNLIAIDFFVGAEDSEGNMTNYTPVLVSIADSAFMNCSNTDIKFGAVHTTKDGALAGYRGNDALLFATNLRAISKSAFENCAGFSDGLYFPSGLKSIGVNAFRNCKNLLWGGFSHASSLVEISDNAFQGCTGMTHINFNGATSLKTIGNYAYQGNTAVWYLNFKDAESLTTIGNYAFQGCKSIINFQYDCFYDTPALTTIGDYAFQNCTGLDHLVFTGAPNITTIGNYAFDGCSALTHLNFNTATKLKTIGNHAFSSCSNLWYVNMEPVVSLESIGDYAFYYDTKVSSNLAFPEGCALKTIGEYAFYGCKGLTTNFQSLSNTKLTTVGNYAFADCNNLTHVYFPSTIQSIGGTDARLCGAVFMNDTALVSITIPNGGNSYYTAAAGYPLVTKDGKTLLCYPAKHTTLTGYNPLTADFVDGYLLPSTVTTISNYAFQGCQDVHFVLPKAVTYIGSNAFAKCSQMTEITIPDNAATIGSYIFDGCTKLKSVYFLPTTVPSTINSYTFSGITKANVTAYVKTSYLTNYQNTLTNYFSKVTNLIPFESEHYQYNSRCFDFDVDFNGSSATAYKVTAFDQSTGKVTLTEFPNKYVPSRLSGGNSQTSYCGVVISFQGTGAKAAALKIGENSNPASVGTNYLVGCPGTHWITATYSGSYNAVPSTYYALNGGQFKRYSKAGRIPYNRAYLDGTKAGIPSGYGADLQIVVFDEDGNDVTAIEQLEAGVTEEKENGAYYNLNGVKVENPSKGIYIHNGKKVVIK